MENQYLTLDQLEVGKSYWVVNGCWEFKVIKKNFHTIDIFMTEIGEYAYFLINRPCLLQILEKK